MKERCQNFIDKPKGYLTRWIGDECHRVVCGNVAVTRTERAIPICKKCKANPYRSLCK